MFNEESEKKSTQGQQEERLDIKIDSDKKEKGSAFFAKNFKLIIVLEVIIVLVAGYFLLIKKSIDSIYGNKKVITEKEEQLQSLQNFNTKIDSLLKSKASITNRDSEYVKKLYSILPQKQNLPEIMAQIEALVNSQGLTLGSIQITGSQEDGISQKSASVVENKIAEGATSQEGATNLADKIKEVQVTFFVLGGDGSYDKIKQFLSILENHIRLFDITSFTFDEKMTTYSIILKTYYLNDENSN